MTATTGFERDNVGLFIRKDPSAVMDYTIDYTSFLNTGDSISSQTTTVDTGMTVDSSSIVSGNKKVTMQISSGTVGTAYTVKITAVTTDGLTFVHRFRIKCEEIHL
mgnify:CR=1 FL=1|tara:strand:- start:49 stop:366 length:318 start_codon:yes stop_codon:yes gene_type:complete